MYIYIYIHMVSGPPQATYIYICIYIWRTQTCHPRVEGLLVASVGRDSCVAWLLFIHTDSSCEPFWVLIWLWSATQKTVISKLKACLKKKLLLGFFRSTFMVIRWTKAKDPPKNPLKNRDGDRPKFHRLLGLICKLRIECWVNNWISTIQSF